MECIWTYIDRMSWKARTKYNVLLLIVGILFLIAGSAAWLIVRIWALNSLDWMICFMIYPVILSWIVVFIYSCRHDLHDGCYPR